MVTRVDYPVKEKQDLYPLRCDLDSLDLDKLKKFVVAAQDFIKVSENAQILINMSDHFRLCDIARAIAIEIQFGQSEFDACITVSHKHCLPLHTIFYAYSLYEDYNLSYERYIFANVVKILTDMGFKPMQIYNHVNSLPDKYYTYREILEIIKGWRDGDYVSLSFMKKATL